MFSDAQEEEVCCFSLPGLSRGLSPFLQSPWGIMLPSPSLEGHLPLTGANPVTLFCLLKVSSHFVCSLKKCIEILELPLLLGHLPVISWSGKVFKPNHSSVFKTNCNYGVEISSCREHLTNSSRMYHCVWCEMASMPHLRDSKHNSFLFKHAKTQEGLPHEKWPTPLGTVPEGFSWRAVAPVPQLDANPVEAGRLTKLPYTTGSAMDLLSSGLTRSIYSSWTLLRRQRNVLKALRSRQNEVLSLWWSVREGTRSVFLSSFR